MNQAMSEEEKREEERQEELKQDLIFKRISHNDPSFLNRRNSKSTVFQEKHFEFILF